MKKIITILCLGLLILLGGCTNPPTDTKTQPSPNPSISVDDMILDEGDSVEIVVTFKDLIEESVEYTVNNPEIAEISGGYLEALKAGSTTVDVLSASGLKCTFNVTVNAVEKLSAIDKFNQMGTFESSLNQLEWVVSNENVAASYAGDYRSGAYSLRLYGGWDDVNQTSLDFTVNLTANLGGLDNELHSLSYYIWQSGSVEVVVEINGEEYWPTWYKKDGDFNRYVVEFMPKADANTITFKITGTEQPWASIDDLTLIKGVVNDPEIEFAAINLRVGQELDLNDLVYTTTPSDLEVTDLAYEATDLVTIENNVLKALNEAGSTTLTVTGKVNGVDFVETVNITILSVSAETLAAINEFNAKGTFDNDANTFTTTSTNAGQILIETGTTNKRYEVDNQSENTYVVTLEATLSNLEAGNYSLNLVCGGWFHRADVVVSVNEEVIGTFDTYANTWANEATDAKTNLAYDFSIAEDMTDVKVSITINVYTWAWGAIDDISITNK